MLYGIVRQLTGWERTIGMTSEIRIDALLPAEMATRAEYLGVRKAEAPALTMFILAVLAGAFIALGWPGPSCSPATT